MAADSCGNFAAKRVPRHFASPDAWSKTDPVLSVDELSRLAAAAILPLEERAGRIPFGRGEVDLLGDFLSLTRWTYSP